MGKESEWPLKSCLCLRYERAWRRLCPTRCPLQYSLKRRGHGQTKHSVNKQEVSGRYRNNVILQHGYPRGPGARRYWGRIDLLFSPSLTYRETSRWGMWPYCARPSAATTRTAFALHKDAMTSFFAHTPSSINQVQLLSTGPVSQGIPEKHRTCSIL